MREVRIGAALVKQRRGIVIHLNHGKPRQTVGRRKKSIAGSVKRGIEIWIIFR